MFFVHWNHYLWRHQLWENPSEQLAHPDPSSSNCWFTDSTLLAPNDPKILWILPIRWSSRSPKKKLYSKSNLTPQASSIRVSAPILGGRNPMIPWSTYFTLWLIRIDLIAIWNSLWIKSASSLLGSSSEISVGEIAQVLCWSPSVFSLEIPCIYPCISPSAIATPPSI